jgi:hypothetical protein
LSSGGDFAGNIAGLACVIAIVFVVDSLYLQNTGATANILCGDAQLRTDCRAMEAPLNGQRFITLSNHAHGLSKRAFIEDVFSKRDGNNLRGFCKGSRPILKQVVDLHFKPNPIVPYRLLISLSLFLLLSSHH